MVVWAGNFIVVKDVILALPPIGFTFLRYGLASVALLGDPALVRGLDRAAAAGRGADLRCWAALGFGRTRCCGRSGLQSIPAGDSALIIAATPVFTAVLAVAAGADTLNPMKFAGAVLSFLGVVHRHRGRGRHLDERLA